MYADGRPTHERARLSCRSESEGGIPAVKGDPQDVPSVRTREWLDIRHPASSGGVDSVGGGSITKTAAAAAAVCAHHRRRRFCRPPWLRSTPPTAAYRRPPSAARRPTTTTKARRVHFVTPCHRRLCTPPHFVAVGRQPPSHPDLAPRKYTSVILNVRPAVWRGTDRSRRRIRTNSFSNRPGRCGGGGGVRRNGNRPPDRRRRPSMGALTRVLVIIRRVAPRRQFNLVAFTSRSVPLVTPPPPGPAPAHGRRLHSAAEYIYYGRPDKMSPATPDTRSGVPPVMSDEKRPRRATPRQCPSKTNPGTRAGYPIISGYARTSIRTETGRQHKPHKRKSNGLRPGRNLPGKSPSKVADITKKRNQRIKVPNSVTTSSLTCNTLENKFQTF